MRAQQSAQKVYDLRQEVVGNDGISTIVRLGLLRQILVDQGQVQVGVRDASTSAKAELLCGVSCICLVTNKYSVSMTHGDCRTNLQC